MEKIEKEISEKPALRLSKTVVRRSVPMNEEGSDRLRAVRDYFAKRLKDEKGIDYDVPYPVCIHMVLREFCELKGIEVQSGSEEHSRVERDNTGSPN